MVVPTEDTVLLAEALAYVTELYRELNGENGAPSLGTQNQAVEFILADPELSAAVARWAERNPISEATTAPPRRLPRDALYEEVRSYLEDISEPPIFVPRRPVR